MIRATMLMGCLIHAGTSSLSCLDLVVTKHILGYAKAATKKLQNATNDIVKGHEEIGLFKATVLDVRKNTDEYHQT